jgi:hypothetical protein
VAVSIASDCTDIDELAVALCCALAAARYPMRSISLNDPAMCSMPRLHFSRDLQLLGDRRIVGHSLLGGGFHGVVGGNADLAGLASVLS